MPVTKKILTTCLFMAGFTSGSLFADCGSAPNSPEIPDGATASMEELVGASKAVKAFIANADIYLDCREAAMNSEEYKNLAEEEKNAWIEDVSLLTKSRNAIGDNFNAQVSAYKEANPQE